MNNTDNRQLKVIEQQKRIRRLKTGKLIYKVIVYTILSIFALIFILPFLIALSASFTSPKNIFNFKLIPNPVDIGNYVKLFSENDVGRAILNTFLYIIPPVFVGLFFSTTSAYALARIKFHGRKVLFYIILSTMVIPGVIILMPSYSLFVNFYHWYGTPLPIIIPGLFGSAGVMFYLYQYFQTLPKELEEAAEIDGLSRFGILIRIIIPVSLPALITQLILSFNGAYNDYMTPLLYVGTTPKLYTIQLLVNSLSTAQNTQHTLLMAGAMASLLPTLLLYVLCQKFFIQGVATTGIKR